MKQIKISFSVRLNMLECCMNQLALSRNNNSMEGMCVERATNQEKVMRVHLGACSFWRRPVLGLLFSFCWLAD